MAAIKRGTEETVGSTELHCHFETSTSQAEHNGAQFPALPTQPQSN
jgi:hypothetical protein